MSNPLQTDDWIATTLRDAEIPTPPPGLTALMLRSQPKGRFIPWLAASGIASMATIFVILATLQPSASLAQVATAQARQTEYTLVNTRILGNGKEFRITQCRDGRRWSIHATTLKKTENGWVEEGPPVSGVLGVTVMDGNRTVTIQHDPPYFDLAEIDEPTPRLDVYSFDIHKMLRGNGKLIKVHAVEWQGHTVDRFEVHSTYRDSGQTKTIDQTIIADAESHLPLRVEEFRDDKSWGDTWEYTYGRPDENAFKVDIPSTAMVFDLRRERLDLLKVLRNGAVFVNFARTAMVLFPASDERVDPVMPVKVNGSRDRLQANLMVSPRLGKPKAMRLKINGKAWELASLVCRPDTDFKAFKPFQKERASVKIGDHRLTDVPVFHVGEAWNLLQPFLKE